MTASGFTDGLENFMQWQNQWLEHATGFLKSGTGQQPANPWLSLFSGSNTKQQTATDPFSQGMQNQMSMLIQMSKGFTDSMEAALAAGQKNGEQWQSAVSKSLDEMQSNYNNISNSAFTPMNFNGQLQEPFNAWQKLFTPAASTPVNPWAGMSPMSGFSGFPGVSASMPHFPGLGPDREKFEKLQQLQTLGQNYRTTLFKFNEQYHEFWPHIVERLKAKIQEQGQSNDHTAPSARSLYNLWIDSAEEEYAAVTGQESYQQVYGQMINAMMALRQASTSLQDDLLKAMNIPTMRELDSLSERLQRTRRENRVLRTELGTLHDELTALRDTAADRKSSVQILRAEMKKLRTELTASNQAAATAQNGVIETMSAEIQALQTTMAASKSTAASSRSGSATPAQKAATRKKAAPTRKKAATKTTSAAKTDATTTR